MRSLRQSHYYPSKRAALEFNVRTLASEKLCLVKESSLISSGLVIKVHCYTFSSLLSQGS